MALIDLPETPLLQATGSTPITDPIQAPPETPTIDGGPSVLGAAFRQNNTVASIFSRQTIGVSNETEDGFNAWDSIKGTKYEPYWSSFVDSNNSRHADAVKRQIDMEAEDKRTLDASGWAGTLASIGAGVADWPTLLPGGGAVRATKGGFSVARSALAVGLAGGAGAAVSEGVLQASQDTRTAEESAVTIGGGVLLGALLGGTAAGLLSRAEAQKSASALRVLYGETPPPAGSAVPSAAGAEAVSRATVDDLTIFGRAARAVAGATSFLNPNLRSNFRASAAARETMQQLTEGTAYQAMNAEGRSLGPAVETLARMNVNARMAEALTGHEEILREAKKTANISRADFDIAVGKALRNGDTGETDAVTQAAKMWRKSVFDPFKDEAIHANLLPADVTPETAASYFTRVYDRERLITGEADFKQRVADYYGGAVRNEFATNSEKVRTRLAALDREIEDLRLTPEDRAAALSDTQTRLAQIEADNPDHVARADRISELQQQARGGDRAAATQAKEEIAAIRAEGGDGLKAFMAERGSLRSRQRRIDLNYAGLSERQDRIMQSLADIEEANVRSMDRLVQRGRKLEQEAQRLDPDKLEERIAQVRSDFADVLKRSEAAAERHQKYIDRINADFDKAARQAEAGAGAKAGNAVTGQAKKSAEEEAAAAIEHARADKDRKLLERLQKEKAAEEARSARLQAIAERLDAAESLDPEAKLAEIKAAVAEMEQRVSSAALGRGEKAQRLKERYAALDPKRIDERIKAVERMRADIERGFYDRWEITHGGEGVELGKGVEPDFSRFSRDIADHVFDTVTGRKSNSVSATDFGITPLTSGPLKERTFNVPDSLIEDFLESNVHSVAERYSRAMSAQIEMTKRFGRADMADQIARITDDYRSLREAVSNAKTDAEAAAIIGRDPGTADRFRAWLTDKGRDTATKERVLRWLTKDEAGAKEDIEAMRDILLGRYKVAENSGNYAEMARALSAFNYIRAMGGAVIANIGDAYRPAMVHGLGRYLSQGIAPLIRNLDAVKMSVREAKLAGQVTEAVTASRLMSMTEITDPYRAGTAVGRLMQTGTRVASRWNGLNLWTDASKAITSILSQNRILEGALGKVDAPYLAYLGIDKGMAARIGEQFRAHGKIKNGVHVAMTEAWDDKEAVRFYRAALAKDVDSIVVTRSVGDVPLFANTPTGKLLLQFRTFNMAANQRVLIRGLQESPVRFVSGVVAMTSIGMLAATLRAWRGGHERWEKFKDSAENPGYLIGEGLDMSGIFTLPFEVANTVEKVAPQVGNPIKTPLMRAFPQKSQAGESTRFASRGVAGALGGPTVGFLDTAQRAMSGDPKALVQMAPFYSYPGMREAVQMITGDSQYLDH